MPKPVHRSLKRYGYVTEHLPFLAPPSLKSLNILMIEHGLHEYLTEGVSHRCFTD